MSDRLRIAQIAPVAAPVRQRTGRSIEQVVYLMTEELIRRGHDVTLFATADSETSARLESVYRRGYCDDPDLWDWRFHEALNAAAAFERAGEFDLIHSHCYYFALPFTRLVSTPVLHTDHIIVGPDVAGAYRRYPEAHVVAPSAAHARQLPGAATSVIHHGIDVDAFSPTIRHRGYVLFLGQMEAAKGPVLAVQAARECGLPLVMAGPAGEYYHEEVAPLVDGKQVSFVGAVGSKRRHELLAGAAALVFPVQQPEPFGLVMVEAMACGTPVAALSRGSVPEVVDPGVTGFLADAPGSLPEAIRSSLTLDRRRIRAAVERRFDYRRMVAEYEELYFRIRAGMAARVL